MYLQKITFFPTNSQKVLAFKPMLHPHKTFAQIKEFCQSQVEGFVVANRKSSGKPVVILLPE